MRQLFLEGHFGSGWLRCWGLRLVTAGNNPGSDHPPPHPTCVWLEFLSRLIRTFSPRNFRLFRAHAADIHQSQFCTPPLLFSHPVTGVQTAGAVPPPPLSEATASLSASLINLLVLSRVSGRYAHIRDESEGNEALRSHSVRPRHPTAVKSGRDEWDIMFEGWRREAAGGWRGFSGLLWQRRCATLWIRVGRRGLVKIFNGPLWGTKKERT